MSYSGTHITSYRQTLVLRMKMLSQTESGSFLQLKFYDFVLNTLPLFNYPYYVALHMLRVTLR